MCCIVFIYDALNFKHVLFIIKKSSKSKSNEPKIILCNHLLKCSCVHVLWHAINAHVVNVKMFLYTQTLQSTTSISTNEIFKTSNVWLSFITWSTVAFALWKKCQNYQFIMLTQLISVVSVYCYYVKNKGLYMYSIKSVCFMFVCLE